MNFFLVIRICGLFLFVTGVAKLVSAAGDARILQVSDPIFLISYRIDFLVFGLIELVIAAVCVFGRQLAFQAGLVASLATSFFVYRIGLFFIGYNKPCPCLGNVTDALHISPQAADTAMKIILAYLLLGSYATLFWLWRQRGKGLDG